MISKRQLYNCSGRLGNFQKGEVFLENLTLSQVKTKPCPLCDEAKEVLEPYKRRFILQEVDITLPENSAWYDKYKYDIPVFHLNGKFLMKHRVDIQKFEDQLSKLELHNDGNH
uniref:Glutaredoxin-like protein n=1 Tax=Cairina moschata TaxID=8855 RepID=A0A8C3BJ18_CAIMO